MDSREDSIIMRLVRLEDVFRTAHETLSEDLVTGKLTYHDYQRFTEKLDWVYRLKVRRIART